ncbi:MAG: hypothetical protein EPN57_27065 [Paraburkholderia sp.]|nr:MAG: hypothetical protein EPN57_27065 [Paraburkholderia sp.]
MSQLTARNREVLTFIQSRIDVDGYPPTLEEIATACGFASRSAAQKHVRALEASGDLQVTRGRARTARPKPSKPAPPAAAHLFEVSPRDIADLSDTDLRALVARLCMARLADAGLPPSPVTWGGDQRAPDGGIDVRVQIPDGDRQATYFARNSVGFQVKATKMGPSEIRNEMCPGGLLRPAIRELIQDRGAYIIATSDSAADGEYKKRVAAMKAAAASDSDYEHAEFDYYDARRLADWANRHPGVVAWVRSQLGRPLQGWQPHGQWANTRSGNPQPFLPDGKHRLSDPHDRERSFPLVDGLIHVRRLLQIGGSSVRLTGLSGVGKTRFAQALFEQSAAPESLPASLAVYTDTSYSPDPSPLAVLEDLLASHRRAILVVDNCGSQLHNQLTARCKVSDQVSLLTIEYDIREDLPLETNVFQLEAASSTMIERVIEQQFPQISQVNVRTITEFADGNSRVAIALANTMDSNDSLAGLSDRELFDRLFWLGKEVQDELKAAAEACALVYSFDGEDMEGELAQLAALAGESALALYRRVSELQKRGLAQQRGRWRAVLPHAIANTLARQALEAIPYTLIEQRLVAGQERLLRSFSRRLGYLHTSGTAISIVRKWLSSGGLLGDPAGLSPLLLDVLINVAPVDPRAALQAIERAVKGPQSAELLALSNASRSRLVRLVRSIAYDEELFEECLDVLVAFARAEPEDRKTESARSVIASLFTVYLSGTHASTRQRADWIRKAVESHDTQLQAIGLQALSSALECQHFSSHYGFEFGARPRDYGASPRGKAVREWFETFIQLTAEVARGHDHLAESALDLLGQRFRSLWTFAGMADALEAVVGPMLDTGWERGWLAIRQTMQFDGERLPVNMRTRLSELEARARPQTLVGRVKAVVLNGHSAGVDFADGESAADGYETAERSARELGELVAADPVAFATLLPLVVANKQGRQWMFGAGLAAGAKSLKDYWAALVEAFASTPEDQRNVQVLRGFLSTAFERNRPLFEQILDEAMDHSSLVKWVPVLQLSAPLDDRGCLRLLASLDSPAVPAWVFQHLSFGRATQTIRDERLAQLLQRLSIKPDGLSVAIDILYMHVHDNPKPIGARLNEVARNLIAHAPFSKSHRHDHELAGVIAKFLIGANGEPAARRLLTAIREGFDNYTLSRYELPETLTALFRAYPSIALDILVGDEPDAEDAYFRRRALAGGRRSSALADLPIEALLEWCRGGASERWMLVAPLVPAFESADDQSTPRWSKQVLALLQHSPSPIQVAESIVNLIEPTSWSGSRAEIIRQRLPLLDQLAAVLGLEHADQIARWRSNLTQTMERETRRELDEHRARNERFE